MAVGRWLQRVGARHSPHYAARAAIVAEAACKREARRGRQRVGDGRRGGGWGVCNGWQRHGLRLDLGGHGSGLEVAGRRGSSPGPGLLVLVVVGGARGGLATKGQADGRGTNDSGSGTELGHGSASVMAHAVLQQEEISDGGALVAGAAVGGQRRRGAAARRATNKCKGSEGNGGLQTANTHSTAQHDQRR
jgi:hypothetical protein